MEYFVEVKRLLSQQVRAWGWTYTIFFYLGYTSGITLFTLAILFI